MTVKFPIQKVKQAGDNPYHFEGDVDLSSLEDAKNDIREISPVSVTGQAEMKGENISVSMTIEGDMILPCARTLVDVPFVFNIQATEYFNLSPYYEEEDDSEVHPLHGELLDLTPYIKENVLLEVPYRVFSDDPDVVPPKEGDGWEVVDEKPDSESKIDPRLAKLESLLDEKEK
nr:MULTISPECIES: YceD family protein [Salimicrobium]